MYELKIFLNILFILIIIHNRKMNVYQNELMYKNYNSKYNNKIDIEIPDDSNEDDNKKNINELSGEDDRLMYVLITLGLGNLIHKFNEKNISFTDLLLLSKESLKEFGLEMYQRNRIYNFSISFNREAKIYSIKEISDFFDNNKQFLFSPTIYNKMMQIKKSQNKNNNEKNYFSEDENKTKYNSNISSNRLKRSKNLYSSGKKSYKAGKIFKKYLLLKKGVDEFLNKLNKQKEDTENMSYKYITFIKRINNDNYNITNNNIDKTSSRKIFNNYNINNININEENEDEILIRNLNDNLNIKNNNDKYNKLMEKIEKLEKMKLDENSSEHLNHIKNYIKEKDVNLSNDEIFSLEKEIEKIVEIINKKEKLKQNLEKYNKKIEQRKKMIYKLENEYNGIN